MSWGRLVGKALVFSGGGAGIGRYTGCICHFTQFLRQRSPTVCPMAQPDNKPPFFTSAHASPSDQDMAALLARKRAHWRKVKRLTFWLLIGWVAVTFGSTYFARELNVVIWGWPFSYWMAAQGTLLVYVFIIGIYAWASHRLDVLYGLAEAKPDGAALD